jgi:hypothetical protein
MRASSGAGNNLLRLTLDFVLLDYSMILYPLSYAPMT